MDNIEKIRINQFVTLVFLYTIGSSILIAPNVVVMYGKNDAWITVLLNLCMGLLLVAFYNKLAQSFEQNYYFEYVQTVLGPWLGKFISFLYLLFFILFSSLLLGEVGDFISSVVIKDTPIEAIIGLFALIIIFGAKYGIETLARTGELILPIIILLFVFLFIFLIPQAKPEKLLPILENGIKPILRSSYTSLGLPYFELFILFILFPHVKSQEKRGKALLLGVFMGGVIIFFITLFALMVLGNEGTARLHFPTYTMTKTISIAKIIERLEAFLSSIWFLTIFMKVSLIFHGISLYIKHLFQLKSNKVVLYPLGMILLFSSLYMSPNVIHLREFVARTWILYAGTFAVLIPMLLMAVEIIKKRKKRGMQHVQK